MKWIALILMLSASLFCSCKHSKIETFKEFPTVQYLYGSIIKTPSVFNQVMEIVVLDDILIAFDGKSDKFFHVFEMPELNYLGSKISKGRGPLEETFIDPFFRRTGKNQILYRPDSKVKTLGYNILNNEFELVNEVSIPEEILEIQQVFRIGDTFYCWDYFSESKVEFLSFRKDSESVLSFGTLIPVYKDLKGIEFNQALFARIVTVKPDNELFAVVYDKFPILRIYQARNGSLIKEIRLENNQAFPRALIDKNSSEADFDLVMQNYRKIKSTNNYIYALYIGKTIGEIRQKNIGLSDFSNEIHIWDWSGNPIKRVLLDREIFSFDISHDEKHLIASSIISADEFYQYTLIWD